jgi:tetratricopeptide (TPR) repeat protein
VRERRPASKSRLRLAVLGASAALWAAACSGWSPSKPFEREAPPVKQAIVALDAGDATAASDLLETYLSTGKCNDGKIGAPDAVRKLSNGSFALGLSLFRIGEAYGRRFGEEEVDAGGDTAAHDKRMAQIDCALRVVEAIANDDSQPIDLRARARYLEGNLHFLGGEYEQAVTAYDEALKLAPGMVDGGDEVGRDAAWNRAIALRRIEDKKDAGSDAGQPDGGHDGGGNDGGSEAGSDAGNDGGDGGGGNDAGDAGDGGGGGGDDGGKDSGPDSGGDAGTPPPQNSGDAATPPPPPSQTEDDRILDQLEAAPTFQQEAARKMAKMHHARGMVDK